MTKFSKGDHVSWNFQDGRISGRITKIHHKDFEFMGQTRRASKDDPQYEIESDETGKSTAHKEDALTKIDK